jgi:hypothetical protein
MGVENIGGIVTYGGKNVVMKAAKTEMLATPKGQGLKRSRRRVTEKGEEEEEHEGFIWNCCSEGNVSDSMVKNRS